MVRTKRKRSRKKSSRKKFKRWLVANKKTLITFSVFAILIGGPIGYFYFSQPAAKPEVDDIVKQERASLDSIERLVTHGSAEECLAYLNYDKIDPRSPLPILQATLQNQRKLARRIVEVSESDQNQELGYCAELRANYQLSRLFYDHGIDATYARIQLRALLEKLSDNENKEIARWWGLGKVFTTAIMYSKLESRLDESDLQRLHDAISNIAEKIPDDPILVGELIAISDSLRSQGHQLVAEQLFTCVISEFEKSEFNAIIDVIADAKRKAFGRKYSISADYRAIVAVQESTRRNNESKANELLSEFTGQVTDKRIYLEFLNCVVLINQTGATDVANQLATRAAAFFEGEAVPEGTRRRFFEVKAVIEKTGEQLHCPEYFKAGLKNVPAIIILADRDSLVRMQSSVAKILSFSKQLIADEKLQVCIVFLDDGRGSAQWEALNRMADQWHDVSLNRFSADEVNQFHEKYPISGLPTWMLVDKKRTIKNVSPPPQILERMVFELVAPKS